MRTEREGTLLSQAFFARSIGLSRDQLASIETGRVPLQADCGVRLCIEMDLNPLWLAYGSEFEEWRFVKFPPLGAARRRQLFSELMAEHREEYERTRNGVFAQEEPSVFNSRKSRDLTIEQRAVVALLDAWEIRIVAEDYWALARYLRRAAEEFNLVKGALTQHARAVILSRMKSRDQVSRWDKLRERLIRATEPIGARSALALAMNVSRQAVSEWLRKRDRAPAAETTLRLLEWVTAEEVKQEQKEAGSALTQPAPRTRKSKSTSHEKAKSGQRKIIRKK